MGKADDAAALFDQGYNCAQAVLTAYAGDFGLEKNQALPLAVGFGAGIGRLQETCGALSGAVMVLGLKNGFKEGDGRDRINRAYDEVRLFMENFARRKGSLKCRELLSGCDLSSEEGKKFYKDNKLRERCRAFIRFCCDLLDEA